MNIALVLASGMGKYFNDRFRCTGFGLHEEDVHYVWKIG